MKAASRHQCLAVSERVNGPAKGIRLGRGWRWRRMAAGREVLGGARSYSCRECRDVGGGTRGRVCSSARRRSLCHGFRLLPRDVASLFLLSSVPASPSSIDDHRRSRPLFRCRRPPMPSAATPHLRHPRSGCPSCPLSTALGATSIRQSHEGGHSYSTKVSHAFTSVDRPDTPLTAGVHPFPQPRSATPPWPPEAPPRQARCACPYHKPCDGRRCSPILPSHASGDVAVRAAEAG